MKMLGLFKSLTLTIAIIKVMLDFKSSTTKSLSPSSLSRAIYKDLNLRDLSLKSTEKASEHQEKKCVKSIQHLATTAL